ncbi:MAG TPA: winged helix DNA-binding domain-containing protein [Kofleriaceae bacterium]
MNIRAERLHNQQLAKPALAPVDVVAAFGAMQAQEYAFAKWAIGLRSPGTTDADIEKLVSDGKILRTHPMRMTHHFVAPADIRWLIALLGPVMIKRAAKRSADLGLDDKTVGKSHEVLAKALAGGKHLGRAEIGALFTRAKLAPEGQRLPHLLGHAELAGLICSGERRGKQITFAWLDDRVPKVKPLTREASLAELARRYFTTRGPATLQDFMWWCGLPAADARAAIALAGDAIAEDTRGDTKYWRGTGAPATRIGPLAYLLPTYDEYAVAYRDRRTIGTAPKRARNFGEETLLCPSIVIGGEIVGSWRRAVAKRVAIELMPWRKLTPKERGLVEGAADRYATFIGVPRD